jgi:methylenetetrahydrofolate reductase (NADPH)
MVLSPVNRTDAQNCELRREKICNLLTRKIHPSLSFEYFPPKTDVGLLNLEKRIHSMADMNPLWIDVTFGAGGSTSERSFQICNDAAQDVGLNVMMHLTCTNMHVKDIHSILTRLKSAGIRNVLALRGDPPAGVAEWEACDGGFRHACDLVKYIRSQFGDYFCIAVAGYPEGHADCESYEQDLLYLKEKVDAGADLIITQLFYDTEAYFSYVKRLSALGVIVPVIPGVMPIMSFASLQRMTTMCKVSVPETLRSALEPIKENDKAVSDFGVQFATRMCMELIHGGAPGVHLYTMNHEDSVREIVRGISPILPPINTEWIR